jgi:serine/threonine protein phosphatase PrpC
VSTLGRNSIWERFGRACAARVWVRLLSMIVLFGAAILLICVTGGFPPPAWIFSSQVIPLIPRLWHLRGPGILLPLGAVCALSASLALAWAILLCMGWTIAQSWRQGQRAHVSSSTTVSMQVHQEPETGTSSPLLKARGDKQGRATALQHESVGENTLATAILPSPSSASSCSAPAFDAPGPSTGQQIHEEAASDLKVGARIQLAQDQPWKENAAFTSQGSHDGQSQTMPFGLFVVADGLGGHQLTGHDACELVIGSVTSCILRAFSETQMSTWNEQELMDVVIEGMQTANQALYTCNQENYAYMEASLAVCLVVNETVFAASVGETRVYLFREPSGLLNMTREDVRETDAQRMGERTDVSIDSFAQSLHYGDRVLLCTDGLWKFVHNTDRARLMSISVSDPWQTCNALIATALESGSKDHIGAIVMHFLSALANVETTA